MLSRFPAVRRTGPVERCMEQAERIVWVATRDRSAQPIPWSDPLTASGDVFRRVRIEEVHLPGPGELPEAFLPRHVVALNVGARLATEARWTGEPWPPVDLLEAGRLAIYPARIPYTVRWFGAGDVIVLEIDPGLLVE